MLLKLHWKKLAKCVSRKQVQNVGFFCMRQATKYQLTSKDKKLIIYIMKSCQSPQGKTTTWSHANQHCLMGKIKLSYPRLKISVLCRILLYARYNHDNKQHIYLRQADVAVIIGSVYMPISSSVWQWANYCELWHFLELLILHCRGGTFFVETIIIVHVAVLNDAT